MSSKNNWVNPFGTPLHLQCPDEKNLPPFVEACIPFLEANKKTEGLFRISGQAGIIKEVKEQFESGTKRNFTEEDDVHVVAGLFKLYLRELPEPIFTFELYDCLMAAWNFPSEHRLNAISKILNMLSFRNLLLIHAVSNLINHISLESEHNKMTTENLSICLAPNILRPQDESIEVIISDENAVRGVCELFFMYPTEIFKMHETKFRVLSEKSSSENSKVSSTNTNTNAHTINNMNAHTINNNDSNHTIPNQIVVPESNSKKETSEVIETRSDSKIVRRIKTEEIEIEKLREQYQNIRKASIAKFNLEREEKKNQGELDEYERLLAEKFARIKVGVISPSEELSKDSESWNSKEFKAIFTGTLRQRTQQNRNAVEKMFNGNNPYMPKDGIKRTSQSRIVKPLEKETKPGQRSMSSIIPPSSVQNNLSSNPKPFILPQPPKPKKK